MPNVILTQTYDALGRRDSLSAAIDATPDFANTYTYDALSRVTQILQQAQPSGNTVAEKRVDFGYNASGQFTDITRYGDVAGTTEVATSTYTYDALSRLEELVHEHDTTTIVDYDLTYDALSRVDTFTSSVDGSTTFTYDEFGQVTQADHDYQTDENFTYDDNGNRTSGGYSTGDVNRLESDGVYNYEYDAEGNRTRRYVDVDQSDTFNSGDTNVTEYTWDHRNRLTQVVEYATHGGAATLDVNYTYDVFDRRIAKEVDADGAGSGTATSEHYVYDDQHIVLVFDEAGDLTHRYLHGPAVDQILADEDAATNDVMWTLADHQGTVRDLVDDSGTVLNHLTFDAFGNITSETNAAVDHLFAYTGRERDEETGLHYYRARYYDPAVGRFISEDPLGFDAGDANLYRYVSNGPANATDPTGMAELIETDGGGQILVHKTGRISVAKESTTGDTPNLMEVDAINFLNGHSVNFDTPRWQYAFENGMWQTIFYDVQHPEFAKYRSRLILYGFVIGLEAGGGASRAATGNWNAAPATRSTSTVEPAEVAPPKAAGQKTPLTEAASAPAKQTPRQAVAPSNSSGKAPPAKQVAPRPRVAQTTERLKPGVGFKFNDAASRVSLRGKSLNSGTTALQKSGLVRVRGRGGAYEFVDPNTGAVRAKWVPKTGQEPAHWSKFEPSGNQTHYLNDAGRPVTSTDRSHRIPSNTGGPIGGTGPGSPGKL